MCCPKIHDIQEIIGYYHVEKIKCVAKFCKENCITTCSLSVYIRSEFLRLQKKKKVREGTSPADMFPIVTTLTESSQLVWDDMMEEGIRKVRNHKAKMNAIQHTDTAQNPSTSRIVLISINKTETSRLVFFGIQPKARYAI